MKILSSPIQRCERIDGYSRKDEKVSFRLAGMPVSLLLAGMLHHFVQYGQLWHQNIPNQDLPRLGLGATEVVAVRWDICWCTSVYVALDSDMHRMTYRVKPRCLIGRRLFSRHACSSIVGCHDGPLALSSLVPLLVWILWRFQMKCAWYETN